MVAYDLESRIAGVIRDLPFAETAADRDYLASRLNDIEREVGYLTERLRATENSLEQAANGMQPW